MNRFVLLILLCCIGHTGRAFADSDEPVYQEGKVTLVLHTSMPGQGNAGGADLGKGLGMLVGIGSSDGSLLHSVVRGTVGAIIGSEVGEAHDERVTNSIPSMQVYVHLDNGKETSIIKPGNELDGYAEGDRVKVSLKKNGDSETIEKLH